MALAFAAGRPEVVETETNTITKVTVTVTLDGTDVTQAYAGMPHGGPSGREPFKVDVGGKTLSTTDGVRLLDIHTVSTDTTNDQLDFTAIVSGGGTDTETLTFDVFCYFAEAAPDAGRTGPVGYAAPSNANFQ